MHRSGTSLVASWLAAAGVDLGERLLPADAGNPTGYFEDLSFLDLDRRILREAVPAGEPGHPDWGWTESERLDRGRFAAYRDAARALIAAQDGEEGSGFWGWKDPRTTLLLDFWDELLPGARYVLLYRFPWEVADSMQRLGADVFLDHPEYAYRIWAYYNRQLLEFCRRHRERCLLVSADALLTRPERLGELLARKLGIELPRLTPALVPGLFARLGSADPLIPLAVASHPDAARLLGELDGEADLSAADLWSGAPPDGRRLTVAEGPVDLSIVIPCHDDGEFLIEAVASAERSAPEQAELLIVNDGSTEARTLEVLAVLRQAGYTVIDQTNAGLAAARNRGFAAARGRYVLPLDADNRLRPGFVEEAVRFLDAQADVGVVYGDRAEFGVRSGVVQVPDFDLDLLLTGNYIDACAVVRKEVWTQCGGYDVEAWAWEDWELWMAAAERGWRFLHLPQVTLDYRVRPHSLGTPALRPEKGRPLQEHIVRRHAALYLERLPNVLLHVQDHIAAQRAATVAQAQATAVKEKALREVADLRSENARLAAEQARLAEEGGRLSVERDRLSAERDRLAGERDRLTGERDRLYAELDSFRGRVEFMAGTLAWRLRDLVLRIKRRLTGRE
jgi:hypothetical protein